MNMLVVLLAYSTSGRVHLTSYLCFLGLFPKTVLGQDKIRTAYPNLRGHLANQTSHRRRSHGKRL